MSTEAAGHDDAQHRARGLRGDEIALVLTLERDRAPVRMYAAQKHKTTFTRSAKRAMATSPISVVKMTVLTQSSTS